MPPISDNKLRRLLRMFLSEQQIDEVFNDPDKLRECRHSYNMSAAVRIVGPRAHQHASSSGSTPPAGTRAGPSTRAQDRERSHATAPGPNQPMTSTTTPGPVRAVAQRDDDDDDRTVAQRDDDDDDRTIVEDDVGNRNESEGEGGNDSDSTAVSGPIEVLNPFAKHSDPFTLHGTTYWNHMVTPPLYYVSRHSWKGMFRFVCKITEAKVARTYPNTVREKIMVAFDDVFEMKLWACAGSQLYNALGSERQLFGRGALVVLENVDVIWKRNERVIIFGTGSNIARLDGNDIDGLAWPDVVSFNERLNDGVDGVRRGGRIRS